MIKSFDGSYRKNALPKIGGIAMGQSLFASDKANFGARLRARSGFLAKVYLALAAQLAVTAAIVAFLRRYPAIQERTSKYWLLFALLNLALIILLS